MDLIPESSQSISGILIFYKNDLNDKTEFCTFDPHSDPYSSLPKEVISIADRIGLPLNVPSNFADAFIKNRIPEKIVENDIRFATYLLDERTKKRELPNNKKSGGGLNAKQRKMLFDLSNANIKYETFKKVNQLWHSYISSVLSEVNSTNDHIKLIRADFHGAFFAVCAAKNPSMVGIKGFVVKETKNTFHVITKSDKILTIPKDGTIFAFEHNDVINKLNGSNLRTNSYGRSRIRLKMRKFIDI